MSDQTTGIIKLKLDGSVIESENDATLNPGGIKRTPAVHGGKTYYTEEEVPAEVTFKVPLTKNVNVITLNEMKDKTLTFIADTGQRYLVRGAFTLDVVEHGLTSAEVKMSGDKAELV